MPEKKMAPWRGIAFERMCLAHQDLIAEKLGFPAVRFEAGSWFARADDKPSAQIDFRQVVLRGNSPIQGSSNRFALGLESMDERSRMGRPTPDWNSGVGGRSIVSRHTAGSTNRNP